MKHKTSIKIENTPVAVNRAERDKGNFREYVKALAALDVGQSFLWRLASNDRMAISIVQMLFDRRFVARQEGDTFRIGRII